MKHEHKKGHPHEHLHMDVHKGHENHEERGAHHDGREREGRGAMHDRARGAPHEDRSGGNYGRSEMRTEGGWNSGRDAAYIRPKLIPDYELLPRDDSGGPEWQPYTAEWGDGGYTTGAKAHLSARGGEDDRLSGDEQLGTVEERNKGKGGRESSRSSRMARE